MDDKLGIYRTLSGFNWPQSYLGKFLLTAFVGVHVPLIAVIAYVVIAASDWENVLPVLIVALVATLLGTIATQFVQGRLLIPVLKTSRALDDYSKDRTLPDLPPEFPDEAGLLMSNAQTCITSLDELLRLKNNLLAVLSHDTRLPISTISLASSICLDILDSPEVDIDELRFMCGKIQDAADRQAIMMNSILTLARADAGVITVQRNEIAPDDLVRQAADNVRLQANGKGIRLEVTNELPPGMLAMLDMAKTEQVLNNLLTNAIKFTPRGGTVTLGASTDGTSIKFTVHDTGVGMPPDLLAQLFTPFTRAQRTGTAKEKGTGLGLWICKTFIELQGGTIQVKSSTTAGTMMGITLPILRSQEALAPALLVAYSSQN